MSDTNKIVIDGKTYRLVEDDAPIAIGDVVRLKGSSNSPRMTVVNRTPFGEFVCGWFGPFVGGQTSFNTIAVRPNAIERFVDK